MQTLLNYMTRTKKALFMIDTYNFFTSAFKIIIIFTYIGKKKMRVRKEYYYSRILDGAPVCV